MLEPIVFHPSLAPSPLPASPQPWGEPFPPRTTVAAAPACPRAGSEGWKDARVEVMR